MFVGDTVGYLIGDFDGDREGLIVGDSDGLSVVVDSRCVGKVVGDNVVMVGEFVPSVGD